MITARINGLLQLKRLNLKSIVPLSPPLSKMLVYHYLHKKHSALVPKIDRVFKSMKEKGELADLRKKVIDDMLKNVAER